MPGAVELLVTELARPDGHPDVRRAVVSSLRELLDDERSWLALAAAATDPVLATALLGAGPEVMARHHRQRYALLVRDVAASSDADVALAGLSAAVAWMRWDATGAILLTAASVAVDLDVPPGRTATWPAAMDVVAAASELQGEPGPVLAVVRTLVAEHDARDLEPGFDAAPERDLPARQRLGHLASLVGHRARRRPTLSVPGSRVATELGTRALLVDLAVELAVRAVRWERTPDADDQLRRVVDLCTGPGPTAVAVETLREVLSTPPADRDVVPDLLETWLADHRPPAARVALVLLATAASDEGWSDEIRSRLRALRRHPDPEVRLEAVRVVTSPE